MKVYLRSVGKILSTYTSPLGPLSITAEDGFVTGVSFFPITQEECQPGDEDGLMKTCHTQLDNYFNGISRKFTLPIRFSDTPFRQKVWTALQEIGYGKTISYLGLAQKLGDVKSIRAAGSANGKNPIAIIVPCHRVIGSKGELVGYAGELWRKKWLLEHEAANEYGVQTIFGAEVHKF